MRPETTSPDEIFLSEIFSAIQGEGAYVGERQIFLRLAGCNIRCAYCDQPEALEKVPGPCRIEQSPGARDFVVSKSPINIDTVLGAITQLGAALPHQAVSVTGGEPLFQARRLVPLLTGLREAGHRIHLETNGTLPGGLEKVATLCDHVSMDFKLDSVDGERVDSTLVLGFLRSCVARVPGPCPLSVKIVVGAATDRDELSSAVRLVHDEAPSCEIFLQPVTPFGRVAATTTPAQLLELQDLALRIHPHVRVIPQTHRLIGQL
jgi:7-carboxy-7-deazaguanine synthase